MFLFSDYIYKGGWSSMVKEKSKMIPACGFGEPIGIIVWKAWYPAIMYGSHNYAATYDFPVRIKFIDDWWQPGGREKCIWNVPKWIQCAKELEEEGVAAITTNCGLTGNMQDELNRAVDIPVFTSSLMQVPLVHKMIRKDKKVGILTASSEIVRSENNKILRNCGIDESIPVIIYGLTEFDYEAHMCQFGQLADRKIEDYQPRKVEKALAEMAQKMIRENPDVGAIVLECTEMPVYAAAIREATGLLVFDSTTLVKYVYEAIVKKRYF